jgi:hypothetical protein
MATDQSGAPQIDLAALQAEVAGLTPDQLRERLLKVRTRQKVQQKKMQGSSSQKAYQLKQRELAKLMKEAAIKLNIYDNIEAQADAAAEAKLLEVAADANATEDAEASA